MEKGKIPPQAEQNRRHETTPRNSLLLLLGLSDPINRRIPAVIYLLAPSFANRNRFFCFDAVLNYERVPPQKAENAENNESPGKIPLPCHVYQVEEAGSRACGSG